MDGRLHRCPPFAAWISVRQCEKNRARADAGSKKPLGDERLETYLERRHCTACPGVLALDAGSREVPELRDTRVREEDAPASRRYSLNHKLTRGGWKPPAGSITLTDLLRLAQVGRTTAYEKLRAAGIRPVAKAQNGRPACYPREAALEILRKR